MQIVDEKFHKTSDLKPRERRCLQYKASSDVIKAIRGVILNRVVWKMSWAELRIERETKISVIWGRIGNDVKVESGLSRSDVNACATVNLFQGNVVSINKRIEGNVHSWCLKFGLKEKSWRNDLRDPKFKIPSQCSLRILRLFRVLLISSWLTSTES